MEASDKIPGSVSHSEDLLLKDPDGCCVANGQQGYKWER